MDVKEGNESTLMLLNCGLNIIKANGEYDRLFQKWLGIYEENEKANFFKENFMIILAVFIIIASSMLINVLLKSIIDKKTKELKRANIELLSNQKRLIESENKNEAILNSLPDIVIVINSDGRIINCKPGKMMKNKEKECEFSGKNIKELLQGEKGDQAIKKLINVLNTGEIEQIEFEYRIEEKVELFEMRMVKSNYNEIIGICRKITNEARHKNEIEFLSYQDQLTGLYNRRIFEEELIRIDTPRNLPISIIMGDVNGLKLINDSLGHTHGDKLLIEVSKSIKDVCRSDEIVARIGGDEFVILISKMDEYKTEQLINRIAYSLQSKRVDSLEVSVSFGWEIKTKEEEDILDVFNKAESMMYKKKLFEGPSIRGKTINAIVSTLNEKNKREELHSRRVSELGCQLGIALGLSEQDIEELKTTGLLHDIGKIGINDQLINKSGLLTDEEYEEIKRHSEIGYRILSLVNDLADISTYVLHHHERWDGGGYPKGLRGESIPLQSRIIAIVDTFDAITSERSYRPPRSVEEAIIEIENNSGTQFDPDIVEIFINKVVLKD